MRRILSFMVLVLLLGVMTSNLVVAQVTSSSLRGVVLDKTKQSVVGATVVATHTPSGSRYGTITQADGSFVIPNMRVGGPYKVVIKFIGYKEQVFDNIGLSLGTASNLDVQLQEDVVSIGDVVVTAQRSDIFSSDRTGATAQFNQEKMNTLPTLGRTINDVTKYNAYSNGKSFGGQDARLNSFTVDGSTFNNGFGLGSQAQAGGRTGSTAISLDALEEVQINIAPFDVRQSGFAGAGINAVTRSGTNDPTGTIYRYIKNESMLGDKANGTDVVIKKFDEKTMGFSVGGSIIKNKLFFFVNAEMVDRSSPAIDYIASRPGATGLVSRTTAADLDKLSAYMQDKYNYSTGPYENFNSENSSKKFLIRLDYNINDKNKLAIRYANHNSSSDVIISNSTSAGFGNRTNLVTSLAFQNSGYIIMDNTRSLVGELSSVIGSKASNNLVVTFNHQIEDRKYRTGMFPTIDILNGGSTYTSVGFDPFTPSNLLNYKTLNVTDNFTYYLGKHTITAGFNYEYFKSNNLFYPASNGVYVFNSLADFYTASDAYLANPNLAVSPVTINKFQYRYSLLDGGVDPLQVLEVNRAALYVQDEWEPMRNLKVTIGLRGDYLYYGNTAKENTLVSAMTFANQDNSEMKVNTGNLPGGKIYYAPRLGFNWDVFSNKTTQVRGGIGIFTSSLPYVWISNQIGNNGILTGYVEKTSTTAYPFTLDPSKYRPASTDLSKLTFDINATDPSFKFPQVVKSNLGIDQKLPFNFVATAEVMFNKNLSAIRYLQANLKQAQGRFLGPDNRLRYLGAGSVSGQDASKINQSIINAIVLQNTDKGYSYSTTFKLERNVNKGIGGMIAYTYGQARDLASAGSTASSSWSGVYAVNGSNLPDLSYSDNDLRHRFVGYLNYSISYGKRVGGRTMVTLGMVSNSGGKISYTASGDMNQDRVSGNDLLFVPNDAKELNFSPLSVTNGTTTVVYTAAQQADALNTYINNNEYLKTRKGGYAERNGGQYPWLTRFDLSFEQDLIFKLESGKKNIWRFRLDIFNIGNMIDNKYGLSSKATSFSPLAFQNSFVNGAPVYKIATQQDGANKILLRDSFVKSVTSDDVWQMQIGIRYIFN